MGYHTPQPEAKTAVINGTKVAVWWDEVNLSDFQEEGLHCSAEIGSTWNTVAFATYAVGTLTSEQHARQEFQRMVDEINAAIQKQIVGDDGEPPAKDDFDALIESFFGSVRFENGKIIW